MDDDTNIDDQIDLVKQHDGAVDDSQPTSMEDLAERAEPADAEEDAETDTDPDPEPENDRGEVEAIPAAAEITVEFSPDDYQLLTRFLRWTYDMGVRPDGRDTVEWLDETVPEEVQEATELWTYRLTIGMGLHADMPYEEMGVNHLDAMISLLEEEVPVEGPVVATFDREGAENARPFFKSWYTMTTDTEKYLDANRAYSIGGVEGAFIGYFCGQLDGALAVVEAHDQE